MKILTLSDGTQIQFPELGDIGSEGYSQDQLDFVEGSLINLEYPITVLPVGDMLTVEYASPSDLFSKTKTFDGVTIHRVQKPNSC